MPTEYAAALPVEIDNARRRRIAIKVAVAVALALLAVWVFSDHSASTTFSNIPNTLHP